ncbi:glutathione S-transferase family protein [Vibrio ulleungensis]|uniref:glutathione transferase n=1 Tax=Vibrio ulleungensis TaxID=2807619 RepID=A0ABS2HMZ0_9VIBR|nr:glutathione S-transferase family protein [Vibrio ulleungensis]MBM7037246.1 glutathione S-transferase family protein [Vibrio ulleungensis]
MLKLISFKNCPFVQRVMGALEMKNVPYDIEYIELNNKPQWFLDISPNGQVPVLITENQTVLFESDAIVEYLDDKYAPIEALSAEEKALDRAWSYQASKHYMPQCGTMSAKDEQTYLTRLDKLSKAFAKAENKLGDTPFFKGQSITNVDIAWLPLLHRAAVIKEHIGIDMLDGFPKVQRWQQALLDSGLPQKTVPSDFIEKFGGYYFTNNYFELVKQGKSCASDKCKSQQPATSSCCG